MAIFSKNPHASNDDRDLFNSIADRYCKKDLLPAQRVARQCRLGQTLRGIVNGSDIAVLEVGCGAGFSVEYLRGGYLQYVGVDYADALIELARIYHSGNGIRFEHADIMTFETEGRFDVIFMIGVLHHFEQIDAAMKRMAQLLKPGGWLVANEPQPGNPLIRLARWVRKRVDSGYSAEQRELSAVELRRLFVDCGLDEVWLRPQGLLSTPFAEVAMPAQWLVTPLSRIACATDRVVERWFAPMLYRLSWNLVAAGRKRG
jgi:SAM-dependent methyltransferase